MKINVGCGWECRDGWINVDSTQKPQRVNYPIEYMDATKTWPYADEIFDAVLSEHMIEHISDEDGTNFLKEAYRTLRPYGVIRISCPDRTFYESLLQNPTHVFVKNYGTKILNSSKASVELIVDRGLRGQGHIWVPTGKELVDKLNSIGFKSVRRMPFGESNYGAFDGIEIADGLREYESVCVEGIKLFH